MSDRGVGSAPRPQVHLAEKGQNALDEIQAPKHGSQNKQEEGEQEALDDFH